MSPSGSWSYRSTMDERLSSRHQVKSILKSEPLNKSYSDVPDVTSFFLDKDEGTLV